MYIPPKISFYTTSLGDVKNTQKLNEHQHCFLRQNSDHNGVKSFLNEHSYFHLYHLHKILLKYSHSVANFNTSLNQLQIFKNKSWNRRFTKMRICYFRNNFIPLWFTLEHASLTLRHDDLGWQNKATTMRYYDILPRFLHHLL